MTRYPILPPGVVSNISNHTLRFCSLPNPFLVPSSTCLSTKASPNRVHQFSFIRDMSSSTTPTPPSTKKIQHFNQYHGVKYLDNFHWLRDDKRQDKEVLSHLEKENAYATELIEPLKPLAETIYKEIINRIAEDDETYPVTKGGYEYYAKTVKDLQYPIRCRRKINTSDEGSQFGEEEILLDLNSFKEEQLDLGDFKVSPDHQLVAYTLDTTGDEKYGLFVKNLNTGETTEEVKEVCDDVYWSSNSQYLFYTTQDDIHRPYRAFRHKLGQGQTEDKQLFEESDLKFSVNLGQSISRRYLFLDISKSTASELHYLDLEDPLSNFTCFSSRQEDRLYSLEHREDTFLVLTNRHLGKKYINFYLLETPVNNSESQADEKSWKEVVPYDDRHYITAIYGLKDFTILEERFEGYAQLRTINHRDTSKNPEGRLIEFPEPIFVSAVSSSYLDYNQPRLVYSYSSPVTPYTLYSYSLVENTSKVLKVDPVLGDFDPKLYKTERLVAENEVPISVVYRKDMFKKDGSNPLHLYGYGSYGIDIDPKFSTSIVSLLDRGFVYAIAHIRGGAEMGRQWYEIEGKFLQKKNTFRDFASAAKHLIKLNYTTSDVLSIEGRSAGGLLMGAVLNQNPELYNAAIAGVPFVDVINTMMDPSIPLTVGEYEEWGDPNSKEYFDYMLSYSPYENLPTEPTKFPHLLVRSGLNDPRVQYWEPAKYVAKLRDILDQPNAPKATKVLQLIKMGSGHFGASGRYDRYKDVAQDYAFLFATANKLPPFQN